MFLSEKRLRYIIKKVINESNAEEQNAIQSFFSQSDETLLDNLGIYDAESAVDYLKQKGVVLENRYLINKIIKENNSSNDELSKVATIINSNIQKNDQASLEAAGKKLSQLKNSRGSSRLNIAKSVCSILGMSMFFAPLIILIVGFIAGPRTASHIMDMLPNIGDLGIVINYAISFTLMQYGFTEN